MAPMLFRAGYPRAFFFRQSATRAAAGMPYDEWEALFSPLGGIMGKVLEEELPDRSAARSYFTRFKENHPEKAVFVHFNGLARDPRFDRDEFFAGHWLYRPGTTLTSAIESDGSDTRLAVADPTVFSTAVGRRGNHSDHIVAVPVDSTGERDWTTAEQLRLRSIDTAEGTIEVVRGRFGTDPRAFEEGAYLAPHVYNGPWGDGNLLWQYNFSTRCPKDDQGRNAVDAFVDDIVSKFSPGGVLSPFDGIQFDLSRFIFPHPRPNWSYEVDADVDGVADGGVINGTNTYGLGKISLASQLRTRLDEDTLIVADGWRWSQRPSVESYNGIENEGWPSIDDPQFEGWSSGLNRNSFWAAHGSIPRFSYTNHKFLPWTADRRTNPDYAAWRLAFAGAVFTDTILTYSYWVPSEDRNPGVFDELWAGVAKNPNWLGSSEGEAVHMPVNAPDLLAGAGREWSAELLDRFETEGATLARQSGADTGTELAISCDDCPSGSFDVTMEPPMLPPMADYDMPRMTATLPGIEVEGPDLFASLRLRAAPLAAYPAGITRRVKVVAESRDDGARTRAFTWAAEQSFDATFYFRDIGPGPVDLTFQFEGETPVILERLQIHAAADAMYREFENGVVFANPSTRPYTFDVDTLFPESSLRRIQGSEAQDPTTNDGESVGNGLRIPDLDGLAVRKQ